MYCEEEVLNKEEDMEVEEEEEEDSIRKTGGDSIVGSRKRSTVHKVCKS